jgi:nucleoside-diphosphate-sugar epimerase
MRVFVTGASGHIGSALIPELRSAGHQVAGLARSDASAAKLEDLGAEPYRGDLTDPEGLKNAAAEADGVIHLAFRHDLVYAGDMAGAQVVDDAAVAAMGSALAGSGKPFVSVGGTLLLAFAGITGRPGTEEDFVPDGPMVGRENNVIAWADKGVRAAVVRCAPIVHSELDKEGFTPALIGIARRTGVAGYIGDGQNRWPAVNTYDAASAFRLALESAEPGTRWHAAAEGGIPFKEFAEAIGRGLGVPTKSFTPDEAGAQFAFLAGLAGADDLVSSEITRKQLGWNPTHPGLIADIDAGHYFA